jgi:gamma-glutamylcyclotransferase (GGCT)/AIG2-like uncharacterized protein YtfP
MNNLLFVYGTLLNGDNEFAIFLKNNSRFYLPGKIRGKLYDAGEYPAAVLESEGDDYIYGNILQINHPEKVFPVIDDYEGFGTEQLQPNEFVRVTAEVETEQGLTICWAYVYNLPTTGLALIGNGKYRK